MKKKSSSHRKIYDYPAFEPDTSLEQSSYDISKTTNFGLVKSNSDRAKTTPHEHSASFNIIGKLLRFF